MIVKIFIQFRVSVRIDLIAETKAKIFDVRKAEEKLGNWRELINQALKEAEIVKIRFPENEESVS